jgi:hypothetical protein
VDSFLGKMGIFLYHRDIRKQVPHENPSLSDFWKYFEENYWEFQTGYEERNYIVPELL